MLRAAIVRIGMHILLWPAHYPPPPDAVWYGYATPEQVRRAFYSDRCRHGHERQQYGCPYGSKCERYAHKGEWPLGVPA